MKFLVLILTVTNDNILLKMKYKECNFMMTYKNLYCALVRSMSEAIDLYDEGKGILARRQSAAVLPSLAPHDSKARLQSVTTRRELCAALPSAASAAMPRPQAVCRRAAVTRAPR